MHGTKNNSLHGQLSINLLFVSSSSIVFGHHIYAQPIYPYIASDYPTVLSLFYHHINIGGLLIIGAGAQALYRPEDMFSDGGIQLKPVLGIVWAYRPLAFNLILDKKVYPITSESAP